MTAAAACLHPLMCYNWCKRYISNRRRGGWGMTTVLCGSMQDAVRGDFIEVSKLLIDHGAKVLHEGKVCMSPSLSPHPAARAPMD